MLEPGEDLDLAEGALAEDLVLEGHHLLDGHLLARDGVGGRDHDAVSALAKELELAVPGANLENETRMFGILVIMYQCMDMTVK